MKTIKIFCAIMVSVVLITGCYTNSSEKDIAVQDCDKIIQCIKEENAEELKQMFCITILDSNVDLDEQIENAFDFIDGEIVSYNYLIGSESISVDEGKRTRYQIYPSIRNIKTNNNNEYTIYFYKYVICLENPNKEGISQIDIVNESGEEIHIGDVYTVDPYLK